jgi:fatty acid-binding protein DegV
MKKIAIIVDAACDLPLELVDNDCVFILPFNIEIISSKICAKDDGKEMTKLSLYDSHIYNKSADFARAVSISPHEVEIYFFEHILLKFDGAVFLSTSSARSDVLGVVQTAWTEMSVKAYQFRRDNHLEGNFLFHCVDTKTIGPGCGLLAYVALEASKKIEDLDKFLNYVDQQTSRIHIYGVATDLLYAYTRAKFLNEHHITWGKYALSNILGIKPILGFRNGSLSTVGRTKSFELGVQQINQHLLLMLKQGLRVDLINASFSGNLNDLYEAADFSLLQKKCRKYGVKLNLCQMSTTVALHSGVGTFMAAFCAESSRFNQ